VPGWQPGSVVYALINFRRAWHPNSAEYQQLVGVPFISGCMQHLGKKLGKGARALGRKEQRETDQGMQAAGLQKNWACQNLMMKKRSRRCASWSEETSLNLKHKDKIMQVLRVHTSIILIFA
jgi:hypothetical protein